MKYRIQFSLRSLTIAVIVGGGIMLAFLSLRSRLRDMPCALSLTSSAIQRFLRVTDGRWPSSWAELAKLDPIGEGVEHLEWPRDMARISDLVYVDFEADSELLAGQSAEDFQLVRGRWFRTPLHKDQIERLINDIRGFEYLRKKRKIDAPSPLMELWRGVLARSLDWESVLVQYEFPGARNGEVSEATLRGDGSLSIRRIINGQQTLETKRLDNLHVTSLFRLVWKLQMWEQRAPVWSTEADEVRCTLRLRVGSEQSEVRESYHDTLLHNRILQIRDTLLKCAGPN